MEEKTLNAEGRAAEPRRRNEGRKGGRSEEHWLASSRWHEPRTHGAQWHGDASGEDQHGVAVGVEPVSLPDRDGVRLLDAPDAGAGIGWEFQGRGDQSQER